MKTKTQSIKKASVIRITDCSKSTFWYRYMIGEKFNIVNENEEAFLIKPLNPWEKLRYILKEDAEIIEYKE